MSLSIVQGAAPYAQGAPAYGYGTHPFLDLFYNFVKIEMEIDLEFYIN